MDYQIFKGNNKSKILEKNSLLCTNVNVIFNFENSLY